MAASYEILPDDPPPAPRSSKTYEVIPDAAPASLVTRDPSKFDTRYDPSVHAAPYEAAPAAPPRDFGNTGRPMNLGESFMTGLTNLGGWADEALGGLNAIYPANPAGPGGNGRSMSENYAAGRDSNQELTELSRETNPIATGVGDAVSTAAMMAAVPAPTTPIQAIGHGLGVGAVTAAGESKGNLTSVDKAAELASDTGVGGVVGGILGGGTYGVFKGGGALVNRFRPSVRRTQDVNKVNALRDSIVETINAPIGSREATGRAAKAYKYLEAESKGEINRVAGEKFGLVDRLSGDAPTIPLKNTLAAIQNAKARLSSVDQAAVAKLTALEQKFAENGGLVTGRALQNELSGWSDAARTGGQEVFKDVPRSRSRIWTGAILKGLRADLDDAANMAGPQGEVGKALVDARNAYHEMSTAHKVMKDELLDSAVRAMSKNHPETLPFKLLSPTAVSDEMVAKTIGTVAAIDRDAAAGLASGAMEGLLNRAMPKGSSELGRAGGALSPKRLVDMYAKNESRIAALYTGNPGGLASVKKIVEVAKQLEVLGEKTPGRSWFGNLYRMPFFRNNNTAIGALAAGYPGTAGAIVGAALLSEIVDSIGRGMNAGSIAKILNSPDDAKLLMALMRPKTGMTIAQATRYATLLLEEMSDESQEGN